MADSLSTMRADVIEKFLEIENLVNALISHHYFGFLHGSFLFNFLYDEYCSFALKRNVLLKICPELQPHKDSLHRIANIRNQFAHCGIKVIDGPNPNGTARFPDSKNFNKTIDFHGSYNKFLQLQSELSSALGAVFINKGGLAHAVAEKEPNDVD
ncbi:MAG: hypothetical protein ABI865_13615 [Nitrosospira sp.]